MGAIGKEQLIEGEGEGETERGGRGGGTYGRPLLQELGGATDRFGKGVTGKVGEALAHVDQRAAI